MAKACGFELDSRFWILILLPLVVVFSWIRNLDALAPLATVANICILFGLGAIMYDIFHLIGEKKAAVYEPSGVKMVEVAGTALPVFFGNAIYAFEGIGVVRYSCVCLFILMLYFIGSSFRKQGKKSYPFS